MRTFVISSPTDGREFDSQASSLEELEGKLLIGYRVIAERVSGVKVPVLPDGLKHYTFLTSLLQNHGIELREWLMDNGCVCRCSCSKDEG